MIGGAASVVATAGVLLILARPLWHRQLAERCARSRCVVTWDEARTGDHWCKNAWTPRLPVAIAEGCGPFNKVILRGQHGAEVYYYDAATGLLRGIGSPGVVGEMSWGDVPRAEIPCRSEHTICGMRVAASACEGYERWSPQERLACAEKPRRPAEAGCVCVFQGLLRGAASPEEANTLRSACLASAASDVATAHAIRKDVGALVAKARAGARGDPTVRLALDALKRQSNELFGMNGVLFIDLAMVHLRTYLDRGDSTACDEAVRLLAFAETRLDEPSPLDPCAE